MNAIDHAAETSDDTTQADREQSRVFAMLLETGTQIERWMNETEEVVWQSDEQKMCLDVVFTLTYGSKIPISVSNLIRELRQHANAPAKVTHEA